MKRTRGKDAPVNAISEVDVMAEVFSSPANATRIYRSLAKCGPYARWKKRRNTMARKLLQHMTPMLLRRLQSAIDWESMGLYIIKAYVARRAVLRANRKQRTPFRRRSK